MMKSMKQDKKQTKGLPFFGIGKIMPYARKYRPLLVIMVGCGLLSSAVDTVLPLYQRYALNHFVGGGVLDTLPIYIAIYFLTIVAAGGVNYISCALAMRIEVSMNKDLRNAAFNHLQTLSFSYFNQNSVGYIHARVMSDTSRIGSLVSWSLMEGTLSLIHI